MHTTPYHEIVRPPRWMSFAFCAFFAVSMLSYLALRPDVADKAPRFLSAWDWTWLPTCVALGVAQLCFGRLTILIQDQVLRVHFGLLKVFAKAIPLEWISDAEAVRYEPMRQFSGWGIRRGEFRGSATAVYSLTGKEGVLVSLKEPIGTPFVRTRQILIGSRDPNRMADLLAR